MTLSVLVKLRIKKECSDEFTANIIPKTMRPRIIIAVNALDGSEENQTKIASKAGT